MKAPLPDNEPDRINSLLDYKILDTPSEAVFDDLTRLASYICGTPIALISLIDTNRQWFKSKVGLEALETPRDIAFCTHAILQSEVFIVPDATSDQRFATNPFVTSDPNIRFYAGVPLTNSEGYALGTLCVIDYIPRNLSLEQVEALRILGHQVIKQLELRRNLASLVLVNNERKQSRKVHRQFFKRVAGGFGLALAILMLIGAVSYHNSSVLINTTNQVKKTQTQINSLEELLSLIKNAETEQRDYIFTEEERELKAFQVAVVEVDLKIEELSKTTVDIRIQQQLKILKPLIAAKLTELKQIIDLRQDKGFEAALQVLVRNKSENLMDDIHELIYEMERQEKALFEQQSKVAKDGAKNSILTTAIAISVSFLI